MNTILFSMVLFLGLKTAYDCLNLTFQIPTFTFAKKRKVEKEKIREFKTFKVIERKGRTIWYEESKIRVV